MRARFRYFTKDYALTRVIFERIYAVISVTIGDSMKYFI